MTKTKIVIATQRMMMGGIEKALISMLEQIPKDIFDVTLLVAHPGGELFDRIPNHVKVKTIFENDSRITKTMFDYMIKGRLIKSLIILINAFLLRLGTKSEFEAGVFYSRASRMEKRDYDVAISFSGSFSLPVVYVPKNINANKKILWIHSDLGMIDSKEHRLLIKKLNKYYRLFDNILCVSNHTLKQFNKVFPKLKNEKIVFYNILNKDKIKKLSMEGESFHDSFMGVRILTVGRLGEEKGQDIIPSILLRLLADGYNVRWYCIGGDYGFQKQLKRIVNDNRLGNNLILMGTKQNPLPFIKDRSEEHTSELQSRGHLVCRLLLEKKKKKKKANRKKSSKRGKNLMKKRYKMIIKTKGMYTTKAKPEILKQSPRSHNVQGTTQTVRK